MDLAKMKQDEYDEDSTENKGKRQMRINPKQTTEEPLISGSRTNLNDDPNLTLYNSTQAAYELLQARRGCLWNLENNNNPKEIDTRKKTKPNDHNNSSTKALF